jgi:hypothetical protein
MSKSTTFTFDVTGDSYEELASKADNIISRFMSLPDEDEFDDENHFVGHTVNARINYEMVVRISDDISSEYEYEAQVIAKIRN